MKFDNTKKQAIVNYILEKIEQKCPSLSCHVAETFGINQNTVHRYINELVENDVIKRVSRGSYELVAKEYYFLLKRSNGDIKYDYEIYNNCIRPVLSEMPPNVKMIWEYAFTEMVNNVIDHSCAENLSVIIKSDYMNTSAFIVDDGVGIFEKIKKYFGYASLDDAICELFKGKLTTDSANHSGEGIFFTSKIMDWFFISSSRKIFTINKFEESAVLDMTQGTESGTAVYMQLSNHSKKEINEVFDLYSNVDSGFTKTIIPLKNIFDSSPISRSQAKRIVSGLEKFKEVRMDFSGVEWVGQGFAHQVFVVFANNFPDIKLVPLNMNENVEKMYAHVMNGAI